MNFLSKISFFWKIRREFLKFSLHEFLVEILFLLTKTKSIFKILTTRISCRNSVSSIRNEENFYNSYYMNFLSKFSFFWQILWEFLKFLLHELLVEILFLLIKTKRIFKILTTWISCRNSVSYVRNEENF